MARVGIGSVMQETNTWSPLPCDLEDFAAHAIYTGREVFERFSGTNTEIAGAAHEAERLGHQPVPLVRAWASSSGRVTAAAMDELRALLVGAVCDARDLDAVVLSLHGAMASETIDEADAELLAAVRSTVGPTVPIAVCLDLHANVTRSLIDHADVVLGYRTYPHTDQAETGARTVALVDRLLRGDRVCTVLAKRPMIIPAEAQSTKDGPLGDLRRLADELCRGDLLDISLFPVQPWLDVSDLGFGVTVTTAGDPFEAQEVAELLADRAWADRHAFTIDLVPPAEAIELARRSDVRPFLLSHSADSPTAGATADSAAMVQHLLEHGSDLRAFVTVVDPASVADCWRAQRGAVVDLMVGSALDDRYHPPVPLHGVVEWLGDEPVRLEGPAFTGAEVSMGRFAVVRSGGLSVLLTERPALTIDPATFRHAGLDPADADIVVVRSAGLYKAAYPPDSADAALTLDLAGASTPRLDTLEFQRAPRPLHPVDAWDLPPTPGRAGVPTPA